MYHTGPTAVISEMHVVGSATVLVVDDDEMVRDVVLARLQLFGYKVVTVSDGKRAIDIFNSMQKSDMCDDIIVLLDVNMPHMDGPKVLAELQSLDPGVWAYFITGDPSPYTPLELLARGTRRVFAKPLDFEAISVELRLDFASIAAMS